MVVTIPLSKEDRIHVCPLCHELAGYSDDYGWDLYCSHEPYAKIEPIEVQGKIVDGAWHFPLPDPDEWKRTTGAEMLAKQDETARKRAEWLALSCDERVAIREKQREANPTTFIMGEVMRDQLASSVFSRQIYGGVEPETRTVVCPRCRDAGCENTRVEKNPAYDPDAKPFSWSDGFSIKVTGDGE